MEAVVSDLRRRIACEPTLALLDHIINGSNAWVAHASHADTWRLRYALGGFVAGV